MGVIVGDVIEIFPLLPATSGPEIPGSPSGVHRQRDVHVGEEAPSKHTLFTKQSPEVVHFHIPLPTTVLHSALARKAPLQGGRMTGIAL